MANLSGDVGLPLVGETLSFVRDPVQFVDSHQERHGPIFVSKIIGAPTVFVCNYAGVRQLLCSSDEPLDSADAYKEFVGYLFPAPNVLLLPTRCEQRANLQSLFAHFLNESAAINFRPVIRSLTLPMVASLHESHKLPLYSTFKPLCELISFSLVFGVEYAQENSHELRLLTASHFSGIVSAPLSVRVMGRKSARARAIDARERLLALIQRRILHLRANSTNPDDDSILSRIVREPVGPENDHAICNHILLLLSAAIPKTMASTLCSLFSELSQRNSDDTNLRCAVMETLRLHPPLLGGMRTTSKHNGACIGGTVVPKQHRVWWSARHANRDETVFENANAFVPERWNDKLIDTVGCPFRNTCADRMPFSFGAGDRFCPGRFVAWTVINEVAECILAHFSLSNSSNDQVEMRYVPVCRSVEDTVVDLKSL